VWIDAFAPGARDAQGEIGCAFARFDGEVNGLVLGQIAAPLIPEDQDQSL
jgi:hypothetical protein